MKTKRRWRRAEKYLYPLNHALSKIPPTSWDDPASDPIADIRQAARLYEQLETTRHICPVCGDNHVGWPLP